MVEADVIAQARMTSERLPGKVLMDLCGKTVLGHIITRLGGCESVGEIIIATSTDVTDDPIAEECERYGIKCFRGSKPDVLSRFYMAALKYCIKDIVRVCCDNPFIDSRIIDNAAKVYSEAPCEYLNIKGAPLGLGIEIFPFYKLEEAYNKGSLQYHREHVTPYIKEHSENIKTYETGTDYSKYRLTLDTNEDWELVKILYGKLYDGRHNFFMEDIIRCIEEEPALFEINSGVVQRNERPIIT